MNTQRSFLDIRIKLIDYYVEAVDSNGNTAKSPIAHVYIGESSGGGTGGNTNLSWSPENPTIDDEIIITISNASTSANLHWGVNNEGSNWITPNQDYWPTGSALFDGSGPAVESPFAGPDTNGTLTIKVGPFNKATQIVNKFTFVIHYNDESWDNNNGNDYNIVFNDSTGGGGETKEWIIDGSLIVLHLFCFQMTV